MSTKYAFFIAATLAVVLSACKKEEPVVVAPEPVPAVVEPAMTPPAIEERASVTVTAVNLGTAVGADQKVLAPLTSFGVDDVIYIAIDTKNAEKDVTLAAKWTSEDGKVVREDNTMISPEGDATHNFKFSGLAAGKYKVEISLNGVPAQSVDFDIK